MMAVLRAWLVTCLAACGFAPIPTPGAAGDPTGGGPGVDAPGPVSPDAASVTGSLVGSGQQVAAVFDLTTEGTSDWAEWGMTQTSDFIHKTAGGMQIANVTVVGTGGYTGYGNSYMQAGNDGFTWSDGTPTASSGAAQYSGIYIAGAGKGLRTTVPAGTMTRTLRLYVGGYFATGRLTAHLGDSSAPDYVDTTLGTASQNYAGVYTIVYRATTDTTLEVSWVQTSTSSGDVNWSAAALY